MRARLLGVAKYVLYPFFYVVCLLAGIYMSFPWDRVQDRLEAEFARTQASKGADAWKLEITTLDGLPITTPARTTIDLAAAGLRGRKLEAALDAAVERELDFSDLHRLLDRHRGRAGVPAVSALLERYTPGTIDTRSALEDIVLDLCDAHGIPRPLANAMVAGRRRDFFWPDVPLVVEADSYRWRRSPGRLTADRRRDVELTLAGIPFLRFSYEQITGEPGYVAAATLTALTPRGRAAPPRARSAEATRR